MTHDIASVLEAIANISMWGFSVYATFYIGRMWERFNNHNNEQNLI